MISWQVLKDGKECTVSLIAAELVDSDELIFEGGESLIEELMDVLTNLIGSTDDVNQSELDYAIKHLPPGYSANPIKL